MTAQPSEALYELIIWDCDHAPDAVEYRNPDDLPDSIAPCYCAERRRTHDLQWAKDTAQEQMDRGLAIGAAVFENGQAIWGIGCTFPYKERYH